MNAVSVIADSRNRLNRRPDPANIYPVQLSSIGSMRTGMSNCGGSLVQLIPSRSIDRGEA
jgi:hypothetical protein